MFHLIDGLIILICFLALAGMGLIGTFVCEFVESLLENDEKGEKSDET